MDWLIGVAGVLVPAGGVGVLLALFFLGLGQSERTMSGHDAARAPMAQLKEKVWRSFSRPPDGEGRA